MSIVPFAMANRYLLAWLAFDFSAAARRYVVTSSAVVHKKKAL